MIKNIIFDIGKVLVAVDSRAYLASFGFEKEKEDAILKALFLSPDWKEFDRGVLPYEELEERFIANAPQYADDIRIVLQDSGRFVSRTDYAVSWVTSLKKRGYHVYYLSNYPDLIRRTTQEALDFIPYMDGGVFSCDVKLIKPDPEIYRSLLSQYPSILPEESVFLDDNADNIETARRLGFHGILFTSKEQAEQELELLLAADPAPSKGANL